MLETSAYIFAMKQPRGYTYIGLVKNLINEGEGHIWWKILITMYHSINLTEMKRYLIPVRQHLSSIFLRQMAV
ncbi:Uncharacterised protein [Klebsiella quasipneumoniae]|uniref:Uncharacterized protein n=1 Tax=Klebsiella pneumoniae TaxID=573 RepID=A0A486R1Z5_KLEPN|nr:hypothetical protein L459_05032 [Klebsiella pneumoniae BIDMC 23]KMG76925.1 hypothetical protein SM60_05020 [Klebsiella pneumoniae]VAP37028.1 Uncharacterised protein [Klebsiella quasipneumoniae]GMA04875.1 hypothetical protein KML003_50000 [Klebsiella quasipneumoniae subsp. similipneumoniae]HDU2975144.1 hypothetical protein [Klebsiella pneumoniae subsp. pneumoniae]